MSDSHGSGYDLTDDVIRSDLEPLPGGLDMDEFLSEGNGHGWRWVHRELGLRRPCFVELGCLLCISARVPGM